MTTPKQREQAAREASNKYLISVIEKLASADKGSAMFIPKLAQDSFLEGYHAGRAAGMAESAKIAREHRDGYQHLRAVAREANDKEATFAHLCEAQAADGIAQAIRAASEGK